MSSLFSRFLNRPAAAAPAEPQAGAPAAPAAAPVPLPAPASNPGLVGDFLFEEQVTADKLLSLFRQAYIEVEVGDQGRLRLVMDNSLRLSAMVDPGRKLITYSASYGLREDAPMEAKLAFVNRVNDSVIFVRFSVHDARMLWIDYQLPFDGGVASAAVIGALRRFARISLQSIGQYDVDRVIG